MTQDGTGNETIVDTDSTADQSTPSSDNGDKLPISSKKRSLRSIKLFSELPDDSIQEIEKMCRWQEYTPDQIVLERKDISSVVYFIIQGSVRVMNYANEEREVALADLHVGDHFGELSAVDSKERAARVVGSEYCEIACLTREDFMVVLRRFPEVALRLLDHFAGIIRTMNQRVSSLSSLTPKQRIYVELLRLAEPNPSGDGSWKIEVVPAHSELAAWAGADKIEVANTNGALGREGVIERKNRSYLIKDHSKLRLLASM
jgi:CRP/FNR family transcriptional regulator, cyclic AMP receptor protein